jgi:glycosyltransferase involved in cell wall biosynthesis
MRVVLIRAEIPEDPRYLEALAKEVDLTVYAAHTDVSLARAPSGVDIHWFKPIRFSKESYVGWALPRLWSALTRDTPDVVHANGEPWSFTTTSAARWCRRHPVTAFAIQYAETIWFHGFVAERAAKHVLSRYVLRRADACAAESSFALGPALRRGFTDAQRTALITTNPRDPEVFRPASGENERLELRWRFGLAPDATVVGFAGRLIEEKGPLLLLDAWKRARPLLPRSVTAIVSGAGPLEQEVRRRATAVGVRWVDALRFPDEIAGFWRAVDVVVVPSWTTDIWEDQGPRAVIEAMMSGCVVVGTSSGAIAEMLGGAGVVIAQRNVEDLVRGLREGVEHAADAWWRASARERAVATWSNEAVCAQLLDFWRVARDAAASRA